MKIRTDKRNGPILLELLMPTYAPPPQFQHKLGMHLSASWRRVVPIKQYFVLQAAFAVTSVDQPVGFQCQALPQEVYHLQ